MKKNIMSLALALVMCMTLVVSTSATPATPQASDSNLILYSEGQSSTVAQVKEASLPLEIPASESKEAQILMTQPISPNVNVRQIIGYPIVYCTEDNAVYYFDGIRSIAGWTTSPQSASLHLTSTEIATLYNQVNNAVAGLNDGKTYSIVGWRLLATVDLSADNPINVKWTPQGTCLSGQEEHTINIPYKYTTLTIDELFLLPENNTNYYYVGCYGGFYFNYVGGGPDGAMLGVAIIANTDKA